MTEGDTAEKFMRDIISTTSQCGQICS